MITTVIGHLHCPVFVACKKEMFCAFLLDGEADGTVTLNGTALFKLPLLQHAGYTPSCTLAWLTGMYANKPLHSVERLA